MLVSVLEEPIVELRSVSHVVLRGLTLEASRGSGIRMRGGAANCTVIIADEEIGSPVVDRADAVVALNPPTLARFEAAVAPGGLLVVNRSLIEAQPTRTDLEICSIPCTAVARSAGDDRLVSVVALGALLARRPMVPIEAVKAALTAMVGAMRPEILEADLAALDAGSDSKSSGDSI